MIVIYHAEPFVLSSLRSGRIEGSVAQQLEGRK
jgi:hypothetical protein